MKKLIHKANQAGTMLVEAMAMLGLIAMVTPILYKKAAERTTELQDINASNQLRVLSSAMDSYIKDNFSKIVRGETVTNSCRTNQVDFGDMAGASSGTVSMSLEHLCEYLPYGFLDSDGALQDTKLFSIDNADSFKVVLKMEGNDNDNNRTITGFLTAIPHDPDGFSATRAARIATMVGSNGGYVENGDKAMGAQGIWSIDNVGSELGVNLPTNSFVVASVQPISSQGLANEDVLHRKSEPDNDDILNTMETDLYMGLNGQPNNIRLVNQIIMVPDASRLVQADDNSDTKGVPSSSTYGEGYRPELKNALYIGNGGGGYIEGALAAMDSLFTVDGDGIGYFGANAESTDAATGQVTPASRGGKIFGVSSTALEYGNIAGSGTSNLFRVTTDSLNYGSPASKETYTDSYGNHRERDIPANVLIDADRSRVNLGGSALQVTSAGGSTATSESWSGKDNPWKVVIGQGDAHNEAYTEYEYDAHGIASGSDKAAKDYALTVNGPAFVKDTLRTGNMRTQNVDTATLHAGVDPSNFPTAGNVYDFFTNIFRGDFLVGHMSDFPDDQNGVPSFYLQVGGQNTAIVQGIKMQHPGGITLTAGEHSAHPVRYGQLGLFADRSIDITTGHFDDYGTWIQSGRPVNIQSDILKAYYEGRAVDSPALESRVNRYDIIGTDDRDATDFYTPAGRDENMMRVYGSNFTVQGVDEYDLVHPALEVDPNFAEGNIATKAAGGLAIYDYDAYYQGDYGSTGAKGNPAVYVNKGEFSIMATEDNDDAGLAKNDIVFQVDNNMSGAIENSDTDMADNRGSVYVRRGALSLGTDTTVDISTDNGEIYRQRITHNDIKNTYRDDTNAVGYVSADRFIANVRPVGGLDMTSQTEIYKPQVSSSYDKFEVNPAYTSVMHDIKLTTRGGARLSDILPDFINKGIYVVDNTYDPATDWSSASFNPTEAISDYDTVGANGRIEASAYLGMIPTPQCPPQYVKVVTLTPASWAMAQAGTPSPEFKEKMVGDILPHNDPYQYYYTDRTHSTLRENSDEKSEPRPLTFQKSTWLKSLVAPVCDNQLKLGGGCNGNGSFAGWGAVMGFIYPYNYYKDFLSENAGFVNFRDDQDDTRVYWNLYPVYKKELEAYATVYCYFDRNARDAAGNDLYSDDYVDKYDQLNSPRNSYDKGDTDYTKRLNDPALNYNDPW